MRAHGAEGTDKEKNILCTPARLRCREDRNKQYRCTDEKDQVPPAIENPRRRFRGGGGGGGWGLARLQRRRPCYRQCVRSHLRLIIQNELKDKLVPPPHRSNAGQDLAGKSSIERSRPSSTGGPSRASAIS